MTLTPRRLVALVAATAAGAVALAWLGYAGVTLFDLLRTALQENNNNPRRAARLTLRTVALLAPYSAALLVGALALGRTLVLRARHRRRQAAEDRAIATAYRAGRLAAPPPRRGRPTEWPY